VNVLTQLNIAMQYIEENLMGKHAWGITIAGEKK